MDLILPFKIGDLAEARSLVPGFNGAWFRSKIEDMHVTESGHLEYYLEYIDYPEEAKEWIGVFGKELSPECQEGKSSANFQIMLRPPFPQWYRGAQVPEHISKNEMIASVLHTWKVGDWVEWLYEDCYWTAKIIRVLTKDEVKVSLLKPPMGEGGNYLAKLKDLRPALDWSIIKGWTVPLSQANGKCWYAARLIHPKSDIEESNTDEEEALGSQIKDANGVSTCKSSDPSQRGARISRKRQISLSELAQPDTIRGTMAEPNRFSNGTRARRYPLRVRKHVKNALVQQK